MKRRGFTLVEISIVVGVIGMLTAMATLAVTRSVRAAREEALRSNLVAIRGALAACFQDTGLYPTELVELTLDTPMTEGWRADGNDASATASRWKGPYLRSVPLDPILNDDFEYYYNGLDGSGPALVRSAAPGNDRNGVAYATY